MLTYDKKNFMNNFGEAIEVLKKIDDAGYESYFVGGCVRDYILGKKFDDIDITTNALPEQVKQIFKKTIDTGIQHGTVTVLVDKIPYEVTTFRTEGDYINHRTPKSVEFVTNLSMDLERRDFTINAMALDKDGKMIDLHGGISDLENKIVRTVNDPDERFTEDALRMFRAFRFASKLDFEIENATYKAIEKNAQLIEFVSIERIVVEFKKLMQGTGNKRSMNLLIKSKLNNYIPFLKYINVYEDMSSYSFTQSLYYLLHFNNIEISELKKLKLSNKEINEVKDYINIQKQFNAGIEISKILYYNSIDKVKFISELFKLVDAKNLDAEYKNLAIKQFSDINITNKEIIELGNKKPGPWIKETISKLEEALLFGEIKNNNDDIKKYLIKIL